jgi:hypothetical protein
VAQVVLKGIGGENSALKSDFLHRDGEKKVKEGGPYEKKKNEKKAKRFHP